MSQSPPEPFADDVMRFLEQIESSFQEAEVFLQGSKDILEQKGYGKDLAATLQHVQLARKYVSNLREKLPQQLDEKEDKIIAALKQARAKRKLS